MYSVHTKMERTITFPLLFNRKKKKRGGILKLMCILVYSLSDLKHELASNGSLFILQI